MQSCETMIVKRMFVRHYRRQPRISIDLQPHAPQNCTSYAAHWGDLQPSPTDCGLESFMKHIHEMLREKQLELARLQKEVEALRLVAGMISEDSKSDPAAQDVAALPLAPEAPQPRPLNTPAAVAPPTPLSVPAAPLSPPPMMMRATPPAYG